MVGVNDVFGHQDAKTFMGIPPCDDLTMIVADAVLIGADCATPYPNAGAYCAGGPAAIRRAIAPYASGLGHMNFDLDGATIPAGKIALDAGDLPQDPGDPEGNRARITHAIGQIIDAGAVPFLLGGDDSLPIPMIAAYGERARPVTIVQVDAHIDWRQEVDGEPMGLSSTMRRASEMAHVERIIQVGQRGIGSARPQDYHDALDWGVSFVPAREIARDGVSRAIDLVPEGSDVIFCLDYDALDPSLMPAVIGRTAGGMSYWQVISLLEGVARRGRIVGVAMVEYMPSRDVDDLGALLAGQILATSLGTVLRA